MQRVRLWLGCLGSSMIMMAGGAACAEGMTTLSVAGEMEVVFDWSEDRCGTLNIPDLPVRAFRDAEGMVQLMLSHPSTYRMIGADFDNLAVDCAPVAKSAYLEDPAMFAESEWIAAPYTEDGVTVYALVHNEYQGHAQAGDQCPSGEYFSCWYNSVTLAVSRDGGASYGHVAPPPGHFVAGLPEIYHPDGGVYGVFSPSNIIERDGFYYAFVKVQNYILEDQHTCLMRTDDLSDPAGWRFWNGADFSGVFLDIYSQPDADKRHARCPRLAYDEIAQMHEGIVWNSVIEKYVLVGTSSDPTLDSNPHGFFYAVSDDLIHWQRRELLLEVPLPWTVDDPNEVVYLYPALIDHTSDSRNFETTGAGPHLYFTRHNGGQPSLDRDLVRVPVRFARE